MPKKARTKPERKVALNAGKEPVCRYRSTRRRAAALLSSLCLMAPLYHSADGNLLARPTAEEPRRWWPTPPSFSAASIHSSSRASIWDWRSLIWAWKSPRAAKSVGLAMAIWARTSSTLTFSVSILRSLDCMSFRSVRCSPPERRGRTPSASKDEAEDNDSAPVDRQSTEGAHRAELPLRGLALLRFAAPHPLSRCVLWTLRASRTV